jgi:hypothetical protein
MGLQGVRALPRLFYKSIPVNQAMPTNPIPDVGKCLTLIWKSGLELIERYFIKDGAMCQDTMSLC